jgi:hypothetical protein
MILEEGSGKKKQKSQTVFGAQNNDLARYRKGKIGAKNQKKSAKNSRFSSQKPTQKSEKKSVEGAKKYSHNVSVSDQKKADKWKNKPRPKRK